MIYAGIAIGLVIGAGGYYLYERFFSTIYSLGEHLYVQAKGDVTAAYNHIRKLVP